MKRHMTAAYCSLGCKVNQYDTDAMRGIMESAGFITVPFEDAADVYIINTCSVTHVSDRKSRQMISRAHTKNPDAVVIAAGCYAKTDPDAVANLNGVNIVLGTNDRLKIVDIVKEYLDSSTKSQIRSASDDSSFEDLSADESDKTRAYLKIQDGCNRFCSYCIIPYARGRIRSRSLESTERELKKLSMHGYKEVVLTGIHLMSYGLESGDRDINDVIKLANSIDGIERIRLGSLEPEFCTDTFVRTVASCDKVCRQFHLSLQSGSDSVLARMNRKYTTGDYARVVDSLRAVMPECAVTTDIIAGFVGETEKEHMETIDFVRRIEFARVHVFPYSVRRGTKAEKMPGHLDPSVKEQRTHELIQLTSEYQDKYMSSFIGKKVKVLLEEPCKNGMRGLTDTYIDVHVKTEETVSNQIKTVLIMGINDKYLTAEII